ncbi:unnamed protein product [Gulo gulo]|uniref:Uncharacterized protein n=1 Tax=Gulo gulo TaxID=48420 RepID=A0A9X9LDR6_GULGU|nr:unnamed protein product [Gulo gulo]
MSLILPGSKSWGVDQVSRPGRPGGQASGDRGLKTQPRLRVRVSGHVKPNLLALRQSPQGSR